MPKDNAAAHQKTVNIERATFSHAELAALPEAEQLLFVQLAHVLNDLRYIQTLVQTAAQSVNTSCGAEQSVSLHHLAFSLRLLYGTLKEGWKLTKNCWGKDKLGGIFYQRLPDDAKHAYKSLNMYFGGSNYVCDVRDNLAFHYDLELVRSVLGNADASQTHAMFIGQINANNFFAFAESLHNEAIAALAGTPDAKAGIEKFCREAIDKILPPFVVFADAVLFEIAKSLVLKSETIEVRTIADPKTVPLILFVDEN